MHSKASVASRAYRLLATYMYVPKINAIFMHAVYTRIINYNYYTTK